MGEMIQSPSIERSRVFGGRSTVVAQVKEHIICSGRRKVEFPAQNIHTVPGCHQTGDEHPGSWRSSEVSGVEAKQHTRGRNGGRLKRTTKMKASTSGNAGDGDGNGEMSDYSYSDNSGSIGSMGSDLDEVLEEDPFAAMEQDELDKKEEVEKVKQRAAAAGMS